MGEVDDLRESMKEVLHWLSASPSIKEQFMREMDKASGTNYTGDAG